MKTVSLDKKTRANARGLSVCFTVVIFDVKQLNASTRSDPIHLFIHSFPMWKLCLFIMRKQAHEIYGVCVESSNPMLTNYKLFYFVGARYTMQLVYEN